MNKNIIINILTGTVSTVVAVVGAIKLFNEIEQKQQPTVNNKPSKTDCLKSDIEECNKIICKLKLESQHIMEYITEHSLNATDIKEFSDIQDWRDRLCIVNDAWRKCEVEKKILIAKLELLS